MIVYCNHLPKLTRDEETPTYLFRRRSGNMSEVDIFKRACALVGKSLDAQDTKDMNMDELRREIAKTRLALFDLVEYVFVRVLRNIRYSNTRTRTVGSTNLRLLQRFKKQGHGLKPTGQGIPQHRVISVFKSRDRRPERRVLERKAPEKDGRPLLQVSWPVQSGEVK